MTLEVGRRWVNGKWTTDIENEAGGGAAPTAREEWSNSGSSIANGDGAWLPWADSTGPDAVLDNTTPTHPTVITAGVYLVSVVVRVGAMSAGGYYQAGLHMDRTGFNASMYVTSSQAELLAADAGGIIEDTALAMAWYCPQGSEVGVFVTNFDGVTPQNFLFPYGHIQRIS